ncbi:hypothetical protein D3C81_1574310 [compost metagenome]
MPVRRRLFSIERISGKAADTGAQGRGHHKASLGTIDRCPALWACAGKIGLREEWHGISCCSDLRRGCVQEKSCEQRGLGWPGKTTRGSHVAPFE